MAYPYLFILLLAVSGDAALAAAVHDRAAEDPAGGGADLEGQDGLHQHHDRRPPRGDAHDRHAVHEAGKDG